MDDLSNIMADAGSSWALLRCEKRERCGDREKIVAVACNVEDGLSLEMSSLSDHVLHLLGVADITLHVTNGKDLPAKLRSALEACKDVPRCVAESEWSAQQALDAMEKDSSPYNWVLLEPTKLDLHSAGCGGLDELKECLPADKVLFGVLRLCFPRESGAPPIAKYLFIHWIGPKVSVVQRGRWNSKLEDAVSKVRKSCDLSFRKTAYCLEDLHISSLIEELARVTCVISSDTRQLSVEWYLEGLGNGGELVTREDAPQSTTQSTKLFCDGELSLGLQPSLRESAAHAIKIVREQGRQWKWVLLTMECRAPSSGGA